MRRVSCAACSTSVSQNSSFTVNGRVLCEPCADKEVGRLQASASPMDVRKGIDPTVCQQCGMDNGNSELLLRRTIPFCQPCTELLLNRPYPGWLKISMVGLCALLAMALIHGAPYFAAGRHLFRGEKFLRAHQASKAVDELEQALKVAPDAETGILLAVNAYILNSQPEKAEELLRRHPNFEQSDLVNETQTAWKKVNDAYAKMNEAGQKLDAKDFSGARASVKEAIAMYPQMPSSDVIGSAIDSGEAFLQKDYDKFLQINEAMWKQYPGHQSAAYLASALACKFAITGDDAYRVRAEEMLQKASSLAQTPEDKESFAEYAERIEYRLHSRVIIDKPEYDRRFRKEKK